MNGDFYIGAHRRRTEKRRLLGRGQRLLLWLVLLVSILLLAFNLLLLPYITGLAENKIGNRLQALTSEESYRVLSEAGVSYSDLIHLSYDATGAVRAATVDTVRLNLLKESLALAVLARLQNESVSVSVPLGNISGFLLFSDKGESLSLSVQVAEGVNASLASAFTECGFNQTRHSLGFTLSYTVYYFLPTGRREMSFETTLPAVETLIIGEVPDSLTQILRGDGTITEADIDDAVDFGNVVN